MEVPACPKHPLSRRVRAGRYGPKNRRRQRWWCQPVDGSSPHRFTEAMPRIARPAGVCVECQTHIEVWEGQPAPRMYGFTAREVASALVWVARGQSYRQAGESLRVALHKAVKRPLPVGRPGRLESTPSPVAHPQMISDWVDTFSQVIFEHYRVSHWPSIVVADDASMSYHDKNRVKVRAFVICCVVGYEARGARGRVMALVSTPNHNAGTWRDVFRSLAGAPDELLCDGGKDIVDGADLAFTLRRSEPLVYRRCEWHLLKNVRDTFDREIAENPKHPLVVAAKAALLSPAGLTEFERELNRQQALGVRVASTQAWLERNRSLLAGHTQDRPALEPHSNGAVEHALKTTKTRLIGRQHGFTNAARLDGLLRLFALDLNSDVDERQWAEIIRRHLETRAGRPENQRRHVEPVGQASLHNLR